LDWTIVLIAAALVLAGTVKGAVGIGLPPIAMGLLVVVMPPVEAAALLVVPSFLTNVWQSLAGPSLFLLLRRVWPLLVCSAVATLFGAGWLNDDTARVGTAILGAVLALYAVLSLIALPLRVSAAAEHWAAPLIGIATGLVTAVTGMSAVPAVPYLQAIGLEKDTLVQAMGLSFTVSTLALAVNLTSVGALSWDLGPAVLGAIAAVFAGLAAGRGLRKVIDAEVFRTVFLVSLALLGLYQLGRSVL
jgi:uncharacterized protein